jgi:hypothetical protein
VVLSALLWDREEFRIAAAVLSAIAGFGFVVSAALGRKGFAGNPAYWPRLFHAVTYILFACLILTVPEYAWVVLAVDIVVGTLVVANFYQRKAVKN